MWQTDWYCADFERGTGAFYCTCVSLCLWKIRIAVKTHKTSPILVIQIRMAAFKRYILSNGTWPCMNAKLPVYMYIKCILTCHFSSNCTCFELTRRLYYYLFGYWFIHGAWNYIHWQISKKTHFLFRTLFRSSPFHSNHILIVYVTTDRIFLAVSFVT